MKLRLFVIFASFFVIFQSCGNTSESVSSPSGSAVMTQALYIYANDLTTAQQFQSLFSGTSVNLTIAAMSTLGAVNFSSYSIIILSDDSATSAPWGGAGSTTPAAIGKSGATLIGIGNGGSIFFDTLGFTAIGHLQSATNLSDQVSAVDPTNLIWSSPNWIPTANTPIFSGPGNVVELYYPGGTAPAGTTLLASDPSNSNYYPVAMFKSDGPPYVLWGFEGAPSALTSTALQLFMNIITQL